MVESIRKWILTLSAVLFAAGVFLMGAQGFLHDAQAQDTIIVPARCEVVPLLLTDQQTATAYTDWVNNQLAQGRDDFFALPGAYPIVCAW